MCSASHFLHRRVCFKARRISDALSKPLKLFMSALLCCHDYNNCYYLKENKYYIYYVDKARGVVNLQILTLWWKEVTWCIVSLDRCWQMEQMSNYILTGLFRPRFLSLWTSHSLSNNGFVTRNTWKSWWFFTCFGAWGQNAALFPQQELAGVSHFTFETNQIFLRLFIAVQMSLTASC